MVPDNPSLPLSLARSLARARASSLSFSQARATVAASPLRGDRDRGGQNRKEVGGRASDRCGGCGGEAAPEAVLGIQDGKRDGGRGWWGESLLRKSSQFSSTGERLGIEIGEGGGEALVPTPLSFVRPLYRKSER